MPYKAVIVICLSPLNAFLLKTMHIETVSFEKIFGVSRSSSSRGRYTIFNFVSAGTTIYSAVVDGHPDLHDGMEVTVALSRPRRWQRIYGWINHDDGSIYGDDGVAMIILGVVGAFLALGLVIMNFGPNSSWLSVGQRSGIGFGIVLIVTTTLLALREGCMCFRAMKALKRTMSN
ncbi:hypothetical protein [Noviherbaspirillum humi]|uniref:hypothetical protein n=1 Tax=Noviherbaspirillum humi TaxID=1688639 RepID=UPI000B7828A8|nr:hypothetical protein [Noviherbaspirillum humi]